MATNCSLDNHNNRRVLLLAAVFSHQILNHSFQTHNRILSGNTANMIISENRTMTQSVFGLSMTQSYVSFMLNRREVVVPLQLRHNKQVYGDA